MSDPFEHRKKRPPPIEIPPVPRHMPVSRGPQASVKDQEQQQPPPLRDQRNASSSTQQGVRSATTPLTSPLEHDASRLPLPQSGSQKSRASAMTTLTNLMEQARASPRKSDSDKSTARSRYSERSNRSAAVAQAQPEIAGGDERTIRGKIESRTEPNLFKMTGQVPPTPLADSVGKDEVLIVTQDLREQCRAVSEDKKTERPEPIKSPKKKIFGMNLPSFGRTPHGVPTPPMPSKAAQILGQEPRNPTKVVVRPIKPAIPFKTPTKAPRSDTSKSLPAKLVNQDARARSHHRGTTRRSRHTTRKSPPRGGQEAPDSENKPPVPGIKTAIDCGQPPTPPAKDTPPENRTIAQPPSPLRRAPPSDRLREDYVANKDADVKVHFPAFALSPSPTKASSAEAGKSPSKYLPCTADEYQRLITGDPLPWVSLGRDESFPEQHHDQGDQDRWSFKEQQDSHSAPLEGEETTLELPRLDRWSEEQYYNRNSRRYSPLPPRFYTPSDRSVRFFAEGETPSKNSDTNRLLYTISSRADLFHFREDSNNGSIEMVFQGDANDINPHSSEEPVANNGKQETMLIPDRGDSLNARVMQELRIDERQEQLPHHACVNGHLQPDQSSSRLTDMLRGVSPRRTDFDGDFLPNCPSAVPSPLHKMPGATIPKPPVPAIVREPSGLFSMPLTPKTIEDHFYMTNEHLDVVGKSNWDQIETLKKEQSETFKRRHTQLVATVEKHVEDIKSKVDSVVEKADRTTEQSHNIITKLEGLFELIKTDVMGALDAQEKKSAAFEQTVKELQQNVKDMQKALEQWQPASKTNQQQPTVVPTPAPGSMPFPLPSHRSQPSLAYYSNLTESGRDSQPPMPVVQDHRNSTHLQDTYNDARAAYGNGYGQQFGQRPGYHHRSGKEDRPYSGTNPYHFANNGSQFGNAYGGGYSGYSFSPSPEQQHGFQGAAK
ncbi:hypothetical protein FB567DRAFT_572446 [Paraphoma chrysanthemicola]|uniref:Uncharacterized protein n=1 Tax=Paraphoma chrysanthemicola TaxID=798071 RepID=A0A8K0VTP3_9PLEO|nr:hypothetical protein FB567DRAFT_572446 [Paraphoma chrysanthemicola]